ncbi:hypothetical protein Nepgr_006535 [Nepenthes gracilis]|uniref:Uncharacterized protein n=1 Tax=Nepenthes gracilis TaxID=150966 RepID=A0AAD3XHI8_NEPGR|nr:hypothetical protein Nepgr_006535 [Nepenthes gracilis]
MFGCCCTEENEIIKGHGELDTKFGGPSSCFVNFLTTNCRFLPALVGIAICHIRSFGILEAASERCCTPVTTSGRKSSTCCAELGWHSLLIWNNFQFNIHFWVIQVKLSILQGFQHFHLEL